jgi:flagellar hook-associated protein 3 FlgL
VTRDNNSPAAIDLGLLASGQESRSSSTSGADAEPDVLTGRDVNPQETEGLFTALVRLQQALLANDERGIQRSMAMLDHASTDMTFARAELGARQQSLDVHQTRLDTEDVQMQQDLSQAYDVDLAQVISDLTARQAALQASLKTIATMAQMTLLNFL